MEGAMSISATRRVTGSSGSNRKVSSSSNGVKYSSAAKEQFVEGIDASNQVSVNAEAKEERDQGDQYQQSSKHPKEQQTAISSNQTYIAGAVQALSTSGVLEAPERHPDNRNHQIGVYDANQTIVKDPSEIEQEKFYNEHYIKHLYENNEPPEEVDELV